MLNWYLGWLRAQLVCGGAPCSTGMWGDYLLKWYVGGLHAQRLPPPFPPPPPTMRDPSPVSPIRPPSPPLCVTPPLSSPLRPSGERS